jgi:hypothetical protein
MMQDKAQKQIKEKEKHEANFEQPCITSSNRNVVCVKWFFSMIYCTIWYEPRDAIRWNHGTDSSIEPICLALLH